MLNSSLDAFDSVNRQAGPHHVTVSPVALVNPSGLKAADKLVAKLENKQVEHVDKDTLAGAVKKLNEYVAPALQTIEFSLDHESKRMIVKVVDTTTQKVLRQIPNEEVMAMSKTLDKLQGLMIRQTA
ncbi:MAG: flagellar protein FlaG [Methylotenera sp.]